MYLFRARDRRLMEQTARDVALTLQRDYRTFDLNTTTELSNRVTIYSGYVGTAGYGPQSVSWTAGTDVDAAFTTLEQLLTQLARGAYQVGSPAGETNKSIWPVASINWTWIMSLYASVNSAYAAWLVANNYTVPDWATAP